MDKKDEETHAMDKPKPLEVVSDGDLSEVKKDPVWKTWLGKKRDWDAEDKEEKEMSRPIKCTNCGKTKPRILYENPAGIKAGVCDDCATNPKDSGLLDRLAEGPSATDEEIADWERENTKKAWEVWLDNVTKPIPDSKGGRGSFQHCINANQDKRNPGGWCNRIEANIGGGKKKGRDEGEKEEVKISTYEKLKRIKDRLQAHNKARKQTKIDKPKDWWDHSKVGRQGDIDQKTGRPWWEVATEEKERRKREKEKKKGRTSRDRKRRQQEFVEAETANLKDKTDYFVEEIRANIIYHNKIFPLVGMIAGQAARGMGKMGKKVGQELLEGASDLTSGVMQGIGEEAEEEEQ